MDPNAIQLITVGGAAGAFFLVLKWLADGKFHTDSEVVGLRADKQALLDINKEQASALRQANSHLSRMQKLLEQSHQEVPDEPSA